MPLFLCVVLRIGAVAIGLFLLGSALMLFSMGEMTPAAVVRVLAFFVFRRCGGGLWHAGGWCLRQGAHASGRKH